jgi:hypothetical protein
MHKNTYKHASTRTHTSKQASKQASMHKNKCKHANHTHTNIHAQKKNTPSIQEVGDGGIGSTFVPGMVAEVEAGSIWGEAERTDLLHGAICKGRAARTCKPSRHKESKIEVSLVWFAVSH